MLIDLEPQPEERIMVVDTGGGTVDISSYVIKSTAPLSVEEISAPDCRLSPY